MTEELNCVGSLINNGGSPILERGFCLSTSNNFPTIDDDIRWIATGTSVGDYSSIVTGLTQSTYYYVDAYAINAVGVSYSNIIHTKTSGVSIYPVITVSITDISLNPKNIYEMGTNTSITVTGQTIKNDETIFNGGEIKETTSNNTNQILSWSGYKSTYTVNSNFSPVHGASSTWNLKETAYAYCGSPQYTITASTTIDAVFPFLWVVMPNTPPPSASYFDPGCGNDPTNYFYKDASDVTTTYLNGKSIIKKPSIMTPISFLMRPRYVSGVFYNTLKLGYPAYYGDIQFSLDGNLWGNPGANLSNMTVGTGRGGSAFGIVNCWSYGYKILNYVFSSPYNTPFYFYIRFIN